MANESMMLGPDKAPGGGAPERDPGAGGRRVGRMPLIIGVVVAAMIGLLIGAMLLSRNDAQNAQHAEKAEADKKGSMIGEAAALTAAGASSTAPATPMLTPPGSSASPPGAYEQASAGSPVGSNGQPGQANLTPMQQRQQAIDNMRLNAYLDAAKAPSGMQSVQQFAQQVHQGVTGGGAGGPAAEPGSDLTDEQKLAGLKGLMRQQESEGIVPNAAERAELARLEKSGGQGSGGGGAGGNGQVQSAPKEYADFDSSGGSSRWVLAGGVEAPVSRYELRAGFVIPGTLISGMTSETPGQIVAQVSQNVYDNATGRFMLIPQGSRLVGSYKSDAAYGQARILVAWQRIVFPDGKAMDIGAMPGSDSAGYAGFHDKVNNHYMRIFGSAILLSLIEAGAEVGQPQTSVYGGTTSVSQAMSASLANELGQTGANLLNKNLSIAPTLVIRPGYRFNVVVTKDLVFEGPYRAFDY